MIKGHRVICWTPYGREVTVSILVEYMRRDHERGIVDEYWLYLNTDPSQVDDLRYAYQLARRYPWVKLVERPADVPRLTPKQRNTGYAPRHMTDPDTIYIRFDDDIVYVHPDAVSRLAESKIAMTGVLGCFALIWNNAIVSWFLQRAGVIPGMDPADQAAGWEVVGRPYCMDPIGWASGRFGVKIHQLLLEHLEAGTPEKVYMYQDIPLAQRQQFSVSCFAISGADYAALEPPGVLDYPEEEHWLTVHRPEVVGKTNVIVGDALVSHYTFGPQRLAILPTDILDRYRDLAPKE